MHTNIDIDVQLLASAQRVTGLTSKRAVVHEALSRLVAESERVSLLELEGQIVFAPNYDYKSLRQTDDASR